MDSHEYVLKLMSPQPLTKATLTQVPYRSEAERKFEEIKHELEDLRNSCNYLYNVVGFCIGYAFPDEKDREVFYDSIDIAIKELEEEQKQEKENEL